MGYIIEPFSREYLESAIALFTADYQRERGKNPLLPVRAVDEMAWISNSLNPLADNPGVIVRDRNQLLAYMLTGFNFPFKGQNAVQVPVFCHAAVPDDKPELYRKMYLKLADNWAGTGLHLHIIGHLAHDTRLQETLFQLGFGAILAERVRSLSPLAENSVFEIVDEPDYTNLIDIHILHMQYYLRAPIFIRKDTERNTGVSELKSHAEAGDKFLVYYEGSEPGAYFIVGESALSGEGFLLRKTNSAQIKAAYVKPHLRGKGIGRALLQKALDWSKNQGYDRIFVEHETANYYGGKFWSQYFTPYMYFSMRYIDNTLD